MKEEFVVVNETGESGGELFLNLVHSSLIQLSNKD